MSIAQMISCISAQRATILEAWEDGHREMVFELAEHLGGVIEAVLAESGFSILELADAVDEFDRFAEAR